MKKKSTLISVLTFLLICFNARSQWVQTKTTPDASVWDLLAVGNKLFAACSYWGVYYSPDDGATWIQRNGDFPNMEARSLASDGSNLYVACGGVNETNIYKSSDFGLTWVDITPDSVRIARIRQPSLLTINGTNLYMSTSHLIGMEGVLLKSPLSGVSSSTWTDFSNGLSALPLPHIDIRGLKVHGTKIYIGTNSDGVWVSPTSSPDWSLTSGIPTDADNTQTICFNGNNAFASSRYGTLGIYRSLDSGLTWSPSGTPIFANIPIYALINDSNTVYAGTESNGVLRSTDNGVSWATFNDGFKDSSGNWYCLSINVRSFVIKGNTIFAGTDCGVWKRQLAGTSGTPVTPVTAIDSLVSVYPNPASNAVTLKVGHDDIGSILIIKDASGTILLQKQINNETLSVEISGFAAGMYFIQVGHKRGIKLMKR